MQLTPLCEVLGFDAVGKLPADLFFRKEELKMKTKSVLSLNIYKYRKAKGLTQIQLAERVGVSGQAVSKWEIGSSAPDILLLPELSKALGVSISELFDE